MLKELETYDFAEVFGEGGQLSPPVLSRLPSSSTSVAPFTREDVLEIHGIQEGENDELDWIVYGKLKDGRWFVLRGGCDYTGWGCRGDNSGDVADDKETLMTFGMTKYERERFGLKA